MTDADAVGRTVAVRGATAVAGATPSEVGDVGLDATGCWVIPGLVDCHTHLGWHAFDAHERAAAAPRDRAAAIVDARAATLQAGVTAARDAGGLSAADAEHEGHPSPRIQRSDRIIDARDAGRGPGHLRGVVATLAATGARWVKVMATGGVGASPDTVLDPVFGPAELAELGTAADRHGLRLMAHAWGGPTIAWLLSAGAASIEHGVALTASDADAIAAADAVLVPTVGIYRSLADGDGPDAAPPGIRSNAARAVELHVRAIAHARAAGVRIALGTDAGTPRQHGANPAEIAALVDAGLPVAEALHAATAVGAALLDDPCDGDLVVIDADPASADTFRGDHVVAVVQGGALVHLADRAAGRLGPPASRHSPAA